MTSFTVVFLFLNAMALLGLPRHLAPLPLLVGCCYMTASESFNLGPIHCTVIRVLIAVGIARALMRGERVAGCMLGMDKLMIAWMVWIVLSSPLFPGTESPLVFNLGQAFNIGGIYFLIRVFCATLDDLIGITKLAAWLLAPIGIEMVTEHLTHNNLFSVFGAFLSVRDEKFRSQGPFAHPILAGSVGATCFPLMIGIWQRSRGVAVVGLVSCLAMVAACNSSGPIMSLVFGICALAMWPRRALTRYAGRTFVAAYLILNMVMKRPAYYVIGEIDLTGSSTGWHRARLIESSIEHLNEWWLAGTDHTRHWMATGVSCSPNHTDITNYYLLMGIWAGLPLVALFMLMIWFGFRYVGRIIRQPESSEQGEAFMVWCLGAALFAHMATCISVAYFDQSFIFMFLCMAATSSLYVAVKQRSKDSEQIANATGNAPEPASALAATYGS